MEQTEEIKEEIGFGDYVSIEMKRYGVPNEFYGHKVVGRLRSNHYVPVPVQSPATEIHGEMAEVVACIVVGISEVEVLNYRLEDVELSRSHTAQIQRGAVKGFADYVNRMLEKEMKLNKGSYSRYSNVAESYLSQTKGGKE